jgi:hypothetical protein
MAQKTFCDRCGDEIPMVRLHRVVAGLELTSRDEDHLAGIKTTLLMEKEFCKRCATIIRRGIEFILKGGK